MVRLGYLAAVVSVVSCHHIREVAREFVEDIVEDSSSFVSEKFDNVKHRVANIDILHRPPYYEEDVVVDVTTRHHPLKETVVVVHEEPKKKYDKSYQKDIKGLEKAERKAEKSLDVIRKTVDEHETKGLKKAERKAAKALSQASKNLEKAKDRKLEDIPTLISYFPEAAHFDVPALISEVSEIVKIVEGNPVDEMLTSLKDEFRSYKAKVKSGESVDNADELLAKVSEALIRNGRDAEIRQKKLVKLENQLLELLGLESVLEEVEKKQGERHHRRNGDSVDGVVEITEDGEDAAAPSRLLEHQALNFSDLGYEPRGPVDTAHVEAKEKKVAGLRKKEGRGGLVDRAGRRERRAEKEDIHLQPLSSEKKLRGRGRKQE